MVTRESSFRDGFDPAAFHRAASMGQTRWAEREVRADGRTSPWSVGRFAGTITFTLGLLLLLALRPADLMDGRDVTVAAAAVAGSAMVGLIGSKLVAAAFRTSIEVDRIVLWAIALSVGLAVASSGLPAHFSRDGGDYISDIPGYSLSSSGNDSYGLATEARAAFTSATVWSLEDESGVVGAVGVYLLEEGPRRGELKTLSAALDAPSRITDRRMFGGESVLTSDTGRDVQIGWIEGSALVVVSGAQRSTVESAALGLLHAER